MKKNKKVSSFWKFVDKHLIMPITKLIVKINETFGKRSKYLETWLSKSNTLLFISLALAITMFIVIDQKILVYSDNSAEILRNQSVNAIYNSEAYVVEGLPNNVDITLIGRKSDLYLAKQLGENEVVLDLTDYEPRNEPYRVKLTYNQTINTLSYKLDPTYVYVTIKKKVAAVKSIDYDNAF